jgi:hypothetical protein
MILDRVAARFLLILEPIQVVPCRGRVVPCGAFLVEDALDAVGGETELREGDAGIEDFSVFGDQAVLKRKQLMPWIKTGLPS